MEWKILSGDATERDTWPFTVLKAEKVKASAVMQPFQLGSLGMCQQAQFASRIYFQNGKT